MHTRTDTHRTSCRSSIESANGGTLSQVKALQDAVIAGTPKQTMNAGDATGVYAWGLCWQGRQETALSQVQPACCTQCLQTQDFASRGNMEWPSARCDMQRLVYRVPTCCEAGMLSDST